MRRALTIVLSWSLLWTHPAGATSHTVAPELGVPLFLKILSYDQSYKFDDNKTVDLYLSYDKAEPTSYEQFRATQAYFQKNPDVTVFGARVRFLPVCYDSTELVLRQINQEHYNIMILTSMEDDKIRQYLKDEQGRGIRTYTFDPDLISLGVAVGIQTVKGKTAIVVNLAKAEDEGTHFGAQFLRICEVIEEKP